MTDLVKHILKLLNNNEFCDIQIGQGGFGKVFISKTPSNLNVKLKCGIEINVAVVYKRSPISKDEGFTFSSLRFVGRTKIENHNIKKSGKTGYVVLRIVNSMLGEGLISGIISRIFTNGISPHVPICLGFSSCEDHNIILMENLMTTGKEGQVLTDFSDYYDYFVRYRKMKMSSEVINSCIIQFLHTLFVLQKNLSAIHADMWFGNIFIKDLKKGEKYFRGLDLTKYDYFQYLLPSGKSLYVPNMGFILKLGDYGLSTIKTGRLVIINNSHYKGTGDLILRRYYPGYPKDYTKYFPDYFNIFREMLAEFGLKSKLLFDIITNVPILRDKFRLKYERLEAIKKSDVYNSDTILGLDIFSNYHKRPTDAGKVLKINWE